MLEKNRIKTAIAEKAKIRGIHFTFFAPTAIEVVSHLNLDFIYIDGEHGVFGLPDVEACAVMAERHGLLPIARVPENSVSVITQFLDRGVRGIVVPHIDTVEDARRAVHATYFAPIGNRSFGGGRPHGHLSGAELPGYLAAMNESVSLSLMIESVDGLKNAAAIAALPGVDYLSFGLLDLAQSLGHPGEPRHPEVTKAVAEATVAIYAAGKPLREEFMNFAWINDVVLKGARQILDGR